jgi:D-lactate dehydrogenase (cytochrome)
MHPPVVTDPEILAGYLTDASNVHGRAEGLVRPTTTAEVAATVAHCQAEGIPLTVTAGRTSTTAASVPEGGWLLSTEALTEVLEVAAGRAVAQAGVRLGALQDQIEAEGWFYPPDPTSRYDATVGATIACNASGARSFRYGSTRAWVDALEVVLPSGERVCIERGQAPPPDWPLPTWVPPDLKCTAGYVPSSWLDLLIGSEGTLGVITRATLRLIPLPRYLGIFAYFPSRDAALGFVEQARRSARADPSAPLSPRSLEYLDEHCLGFAAERVGSVPKAARAALFCEQELSCGDDEHLEAWLAALQAHHALVDDTVVADDPRSQGVLRELRHAVPAGINEQIVRNRMPKVATDLAVPDSGLVAMMDLYESCPLPFALFGHIGDNHLHLNLLPRSEAELTEARAFYDLLARRAIDLGGTVSAEHGIGKLKREHLRWFVGDDVVEQFQALRAHVDPAGILGRGNLVATDRGL